MHLPCPSCLTHPPDYNTSHLTLLLATLQDNLIECSASQRLAARPLTKDTPAKAIWTRLDATAVLYVPGLVLVVPATNRYSEPYDRLSTMQTALIRRQDYRNYPTKS